MLAACSEKGHSRPALLAQASLGGTEQREGELPAHSIRVSRKARRIRLRVLPGKGLEVVLPPKADPALVPEVLKRHRAWVEKALHRMSMDGQYPEKGVPSLLRLKGGKEEVDLAFHDGPPCSPPLPRGSRLAAPAQGLLTPPRRALVLPREGPELAFRRLREWLREEARLYFSGILAEVARQHGFVHAALSIRFQRSRWGSCSARGNISLNAALLFVPEELSRYIAAHELCHTRQMNHSPAFWKLLSSVEPDALAKDRAMRDAWRYVPGWLFA